jgi:hypothetical protein
MTYRSASEEWSRQACRSPALRLLVTAGSALAAGPDRVWQTVHARIARLFAASRVGHVALSGWPAAASARERRGVPWGKPGRGRGGER